MNTKRPACHYLRRNHGCYAPQSHIVVYVDTRETSITPGSRRRYKALLCGAALYFRTYDGKPSRTEDFSFTTAEQFWTWSIRHHKKKRSLWVWAFGVGETLTYLNFWDLVDNGFYELRGGSGVKAKIDDDAKAVAEADDYLLCTMDPPTIIKARHGKDFLHAVDIRNYFNEPFGEIAKWTGKPAARRPAGDIVTMPRLDFCFAQAKILRAAVAKLMHFWTSNQFGVFRYTASSLSFAAFRHRFKNSEILIDDHKPSRELSRLALCTGECRLWHAGPVVTTMQAAAFAARRRKRGEVPPRVGPIYVVDCNSCYPYCMRENLYPRALQAWKPAGTLDDLAAWLPHLCLVARVRLDTPERPYPVMVNGERWFCVGKFWTALAGPELAQAFADGAITDVGQIAAYVPGRLFTAFVDALYPMKVKAKQDDDRASYRFLKLMLDALPGKFAQRNTGWTWADDPGTGQRWGTFRKERDSDGVSRLYRVIAGYVQRSGDKLDALDSLPAIAAFCNAYARVYMHSVRRIVREENVLYQDTDSLHLTEEGFTRLQAAGLVDEYALGKFHLDLVAESAEYRGPKDYTIDGTHVYAGMKHDADLSRAGEFDQDETSRLDIILGRKPKGIVMVERVNRTFGSLHPRGILHAGGRVTPAKLTGHRLTLVPPGEEAAQVEQPSKRR